MGKRFERAVSIELIRIHAGAIGKGAARRQIRQVTHCDRKRERYKPLGISAYSRSAGRYVGVANVTNTKTRFVRVLKRMTKLKKKKTIIELRF